MKIEVVLNGKKRELEIGGLKGRYINELLDIGLKITQANEGDVDEIKHLLQRQDEIAAEISGLSVEELNDLDVEDKAKIVQYINEKTSNIVGFMKPSQR